MSEIIDELRRMAAVAADQYTIGTTAYWIDEQLGALLDKRVSARYLQAPVERIRTRDSKGIFVIVNGEVEVAGRLDVDTAVVIDNTGSTIAGVTFHPDGRMEFDADQSSRPLFLTGLAYDLNAAAADVLTDWASAVKEGYDVTADGQTLTRSQRHKQMLEQAKTFRNRALAGSVRMHRSDVRPVRRSRRRW